MYSTDCMFIRVETEAAMQIRTQKCNDIDFIESTVVLFPPLFSVRIMAHSKIDSIPTGSIQGNMVLGEYA